MLGERSPQGHRLAHIAFDGQLARHEGARGIQLALKERRKGIGIRAQRDIGFVIADTDPTAIDNDGAQIADLELCRAGKSIAQFLFQELNGFLQNVAHPRLPFFLIPTGGEFCARRVIILYMRKISRFLKPLVAAFLLGTPAYAQDVALDDLFDALRQADASDASQIVEKIWREWSKSGSPAMDFLLARGREALEAENYPQAIAHFSALIDHAPEFAEAYNARATAYFNAGLYGPSLNDIQVVLALNPRHFGALSGLAIILTELGYDAQALDAWRRVAELHPQQEGLAQAIERLSRKVEGRAL